MLINWFGECSFLLQDSFHHKIVIDPYDLCSMNKLLEYNPEVLTLSHLHFNIEKSSYGPDLPIIINKPGTYNFDFINIIGYSTFHDNSLGMKRGDNIIYTYTFDNMNICHLGYLGHMPSTDIIKSLGTIDILFIPIGGHFTLDSEKAANLVTLIKPKIIIPMYYKTYDSSYYLDSCNDFITLMDSILKVNDPLLDTATLDTTIPVTILMKETKLITIEKKTV